jgi:rhodanese-related sulfurtransferase
VRTPVPLRHVLDVTILLLLVVTAWRIVSNTAHDPADSALVRGITPAIKIGDLLALPGVTWSAPRTVVLVVSSSCPACNDNLPFYRRLATIATPQLQVVVVSTQPISVIGAWLNGNHVSLKSIHKLNDPLSLGLTLTPMVVILNAQGRVTDLMIRKLDDRGQAQVLERLTNPNALALDNSGPIREISTQELATLSLSSRHKIQLLDVRSRDGFRDGHRVDATNIPAPELNARAAIELDKSVPVIVDCLQPGRTACRSAAWTLIDAGFHDVSLLIR